MPENTLDGDLLLRLLGAKDYEIAVRDQAIANLTTERDKALRALEASIAGPPPPPPPFDGGVLPCQSPGSSV